MHVKIIRDDTTSSEEKILAERIIEAIQGVSPKIDCEVITDAGQSEDGHNIRVQCFGEFEVFGNGKPLVFKRVRTKELLAVLVCHRGSMLSMGTLMSILWEDGEDTDSDRSYLRTMISDLKKTLADAGAGDIIIKKYNSIGIDPSLIDCDYYDFLEGKWEAVQHYNGQFMKQYTWAEYELAQI